MSYDAEFKTVDAVMAAKSDTSGVDAFVLSVVKAERQLRKLFTHLVFQFPCFSIGDIDLLRKTLADNTQVYFRGLERGFDALYSRRIADLVGPEYLRLRQRLTDSVDLRNKIFHGQIPAHFHSTEKFHDFVRDVRGWCQVLALNASTEFCYDGFERNSLKKSKVTDLHTRYKTQFKNISDYELFIRSNMER